MTPHVSVTQRAYTLRLRGVNEGDDSWREALWATHEAVNKGAKVFGDWLLTLRGGLSHELAEPPPSPKAKTRTDREIAALRKSRRILLAVSWLSVEDERGAPEDAIIAYGDACQKERDTQDSRDRKVEAALRGMLSKRGLSTDVIDAWLRDCESSLKVRIRHDAVWVNRSACFDREAERLDGALTQDAIWDLLRPVFGSAEKMLAPGALGEDDDRTDTPTSSEHGAPTTSGETARSGESDDNDGLEAGLPVAKDLVKKAGKWLSLRYKAEGGADYAGVADRYDRIAEALDEAPDLISGERLIERIADAVGCRGQGRDGVVKTVGYAGSKRRGTFFSRLEEINPAQTYRPADLTLLLKSTRDKAADLRESCASREADPKGPRPWSKIILQDVVHACGFEYDRTARDGGDSSQDSTGEKNEGGANHREYSVMLGHAMRRVSIAHSWIKRAEVARAKFDSDRARLERVPSAIRNWLDEFFKRRGGGEGYSVRRRALGGKHAKAWKAVIAAWKKCSTSKERSQAVGQVQSDWDDDEKFGHADLFIALADDDAFAVWKDGPEALIDYVAAKDAEHRMRRYKVPAYRHPDACHNPVFTDFGDSLWRVEYEAHKLRYRAAELERAVDVKRQGVAKHPSGSDSRRKAERALKSAETRLEKARAGIAQMGASARVKLRLWNGRQFAWSDELSGGITWHSSRLRNDLGLDSKCNGLPVGHVPTVTRADRLGRASRRISGGGSVTVANVFFEKHWNARLQAPRRDLESMAKRISQGKPAKAIRWFLTFSPRLEPSGPFVDYARLHGLRLDQKRDGDGRVILLAPDLKQRRRNEWRGIAYPFWHPDHRQGTIGHAKILLSRLPGLRVLSVDLGQRFAAACAVWEALPVSAMIGEIDGRSIVAGGMGEHDLYCHTSHVDQHGKTRTTIYRRIGEHFLRDPETAKATDIPHPAPWARLDRQFFIKLHGEKWPARDALKMPKHAVDEGAMVSDLAKSLGLLREDMDTARGRGVDELMRRAVRIATLGLKRHGRRAKIAYAFMPDCPGIPGMGGALKPTRGDEAHIRFLTDALMDWHALGGDTDWDGSAARNLWNEHIKPLPGGFDVLEPSPRDPVAEQPTRKQRREREEELREKLKRIAEYFANTDGARTRRIYEAWEKVWSDDDGIERTKHDFEHTLIRNGSGKVIGSRTSPKRGKETSGGWHGHLRLLTDWIMGWRLPGVEDKHWTRHVGGLSLTRIATMRALYQLHKAFAMRPRPDNVQGAPERGESNAGVAQSILDAMERMREQRVKQIASRIVEAALGVGIERDRVWDKAKRKWRYPKRPRELLYHVDDQGVAHGDRRFKTCHAVVIENLRNYRPDELQTRRENRSLMNWSSGKVRKYLEEACQLHGLHLREVMPNYTSRQCSRTGLPGIRCADVSVSDFLDKPWWRKAVKRAKERELHPTREKPYDAEAQLLVAIDLLWPDRNSVPEADRTMYGDKVQSAKPLRLISKGGDLLVAASPPSCQAHGQTACPFCDGKRALQADLNAAANIGLRALLDPDFLGKWWYVPCDSETGKPANDKCAGAACLDLGEPLIAKVASEHGNSGRGKKRSGQKTNAWRDVGGVGEWETHGAYWAAVKERVVSMLRDANGTPATFGDVAPGELPW